MILTSEYHCYCVCVFVFAHSSHAYTSVGDKKKIYLSQILPFVVKIYFIVEDRQVHRGGQQGRHFPRGIVVCNSISQVPRKVSSRGVERGHEGFRCSCPLFPSLPCKFCGC